MKTKLLLLILFFSSVYHAQQLDTVRCYFDFDKSIVLHPNDSLFQVLKKKANDTPTDLELYAYTDTIGSIEYNKKLAQRRLEAVLKFIDTTQYNVTSNVIGETSSMQLEQNRRVDICFKSTSSVEELKPKGDTVILDIQFYNNSPVILPRCYEELQKLLDYVIAHPEMDIELHGHVCCGPGYDLSVSRAISVKKYLIENNIAAERITCFGHSNDQPRFKETSSYYEQMNRRVECVFRKNE